MLLPNNQFDHFYRGGDRIKALRGGPGGPQRPEEWIASATTRAGEALQGLSTLPSGELVDAVHTREVRPGDGILVPAGTAHFIGEGVLLTELQEPTDLSILLEWDGFAVDGDAEGHLGLGFDVALDALDLTVWSDDD